MLRWLDLQWTRLCCRFLRHDATDFHPPDEHGNFYCLRCGGVFSGYSTP